MDFRQEIYFAQRSGKYGLHRRLFQHGKACRCKLFFCVRKFGKERNFRVFLDGGEKRGGTLPKAEHTCIKNPAFFAVLLYILLADVKQDMQKTSGNSHIGAVFGLQEIAEGAKIPVFWQKFANAVRELSVDVGIIRIAGNFSGEQTVLD